jgi:hypothetical protein
MNNYKINGIIICFYDMFYLNHKIFGLTHEFQKEFIKSWFIQKTDFVNQPNGRTMIIVVFLG